MNRLPFARHPSFAERAAGIAVPRFFIGFLVALFCYSMATAQGSNNDMDLLPLDLSEEMRATVQNDKKAWPQDASIDENHYYVGPGDVLGVYSGKNYDLTVNPESMIFFPGFPPISVKDMSLADAKKAIKSALGKRLRADLIHVSIQSIKTIKIQILGEVENPGVLVSPGNTRVAELVQKAGGFSGAAAIPFVDILHQDGTKTSLNLGEYYRTGDLKVNPYPRIGDRILVLTIDKSKPYAEVLTRKGSLLLQLTAPTKMSEILPVVAGVSRFPRSIATTNPKNDPKEPTYTAETRSARINTHHVLTGPDLMNYTLKGGDVVELFTEEQVVYIEGGVQRPFVYAYKPGKSARDYIAEAGLSLDSKYYGTVVVRRTDGTKESLSIHTTRIFPGDHIYVRRNAYTGFKDFLVTVSSMATIVLTIVYLMNAI